MHTIILYNMANEAGLKRDATLLNQYLNATVKDPLEPAVPCDLLFHLEIPYYGWMAFAKVNAFMINPEWWEDAWDPYLLKADILVFKCESDMHTFKKLHNTGDAKCFFLPWCSDENPTVSIADKTNVGCLWLLNSSINKRAAAQHILPLWKEEWPPLHVYTTKPLDISSMSANVSLTITSLSAQERVKLQKEFRTHLMFSAAEALCMTGLEGESYGSFLLGNSLPTYVENFKASYISLTPATLEPYKSGSKDTFASLTQEALGVAIDALVNSDYKQTFSDALEGSIRRQANFEKYLEILLNCVKPFLIKNPLQPIYLADEWLPKISVITLLHNRKAFIDLAFHNLLATDYPKEKIEWVVVDDSEDPEEQASDKIIKFGRESSPLSVTYIPLSKRTIGRKRNVGIFRCQHDIILFMDDDDHYPVSSFRRRVSALLTHPWKPRAAVCTTIACYDLVRGTSAVNTPPWGLPLAQRISEATLVFHKSWWEEKNFPNVNIAEGEGFLEGREEDVLELQPQQMIVAMSHGKNASSRRISGKDDKPFCFWGFPKEFLVFLHKLVGVQVET